MIQMAQLFSSCYVYRYFTDTQLETIRGIVAVQERILDDKPLLEMAILRQFAG